jgi:hypothetical protein
MIYATPGTLQTVPQRGAETTPSPPEGLFAVAGQPCEKLCVET